MTAHIVFPALDPSGAAATMSGPILTGLLREQLGFRGFVVSDSLQMRAIADHIGVGDAAVAAVRAGCDAVLALGSEDLQRDVLVGLAVAIERGEITAERVTTAAARLAAALVRRAAAALKASAGEARAPLEAVVGAARHQAVARRIADAAVTLVRDEHQVLPLRGPRVGVVSVGGDAAPARTLEAALRRHGAAPRTLGPVDDLASVDQVIAVTCSRGRLDPTHAAVVQALHRRAGDRLVVVATGDPYDLLQVPEVAAYIATYGSDPHTLDATARVLLGALTPTGHLPVSLPGSGAEGHRHSGAVP
jgi:beta-N-acetylhexosaminidase